MYDKGHNGVVLVMGDFNAPTGIGEDEGDLVCGPHGISHQDAAGRLLKTTAGIPINLVDLRVRRGKTWTELSNLNRNHQGDKKRKNRNIK